MLLNRTRAVAVAIVAVVHAVLSAVLWLWMAGTTGLGFKDRLNWSNFDHAQATVVPILAQSLTLPGRLLLPLVDRGLGLFALLVVNSALWAFVIVSVFCLVRSWREQHDR